MLGLRTAVTACLLVSVLGAETSAAVEFPHGARDFTPAGAIAIVGYNDMAEMIGALDARFASLHPGFQFAPDLKGTRTAPPALAAGVSAFAPMGAEFSARELADYRAVVGAEPLMFRIAHCSLDPRALSGPLAIIVHRDNPLAALTLPALARIYAEGDPVLRPCGLKASAALGLFFRARVLGERPFTADFSGFAQSAEVVAHVAADPHAIGFAALNRAIVEPGVKILALAPGEGAPPVAPTRETILAGGYPLDRFLLIYARAPLDPFVREYLRLVLSKEGQKIIGAGSIGYLPLSETEAAAEFSKLP